MDPVNHIPHEYQQGHAGLGSSQPVVFLQKRDGAEGGHHQKIQSHTGPKKPAQSSFHYVTSSFGSTLEFIRIIIANPTKSCNRFLSGFHGKINVYFLPELCYTLM